MDISNDSPFTGVFKAGETVSGLIRLGAAADFPGLTPGIGVKFLRTGTMSANLVALKSLDAIPNENYNFFAVTLSNLISPEAGTFAGTLGAKRFCSGTGIHLICHKYVN